MNREFTSNTELSTDQVETLVNIIERDHDNRCTHVQVI